MKYGYPIPPTQGVPSWFLNFCTCFNREIAAGHPVYENGIVTTRIQIVLYANGWQDLLTNNVNFYAIYHECANSKFNRRVTRFVKCTRNGVVRTKKTRKCYVGTYTAATYVILLFYLIYNLRIFVFVPKETASIWGRSVSNVQIRMNVMKLSKKINK